ncbi:MAG: hypothetical protein IKA12_05040 [Clostridia bacterium]|nr:hypothetical protein [Clostridia bacterium]
MSNSENITIFSYLVVFIEPIENSRQSEVVDAKNGKEAINMIKEKYKGYFFGPTVLYIQKLD